MKNGKQPQRRGRKGRRVLRDVFKIVSFSLRTSAVSAASALKLLLLLVILDTSEEFIKMERNVMSHPRIFEIWKQHRQRNQTQAKIAVGFDLAWARWGLTVCTLLFALNLEDFGPLMQSVTTKANAAIGTLMALYFAHLLFFRLQCSLLELCAIVAVLGNAQGLLLTTPGLTLTGPFGLYLIPLLTAWVLYGAVKGLVQGKLLSVSTAHVRLLLLFANWFTLAAPALVLAGFVLCFGRDLGSTLQAVISRPMALWGIPILIFGVFGICGSIWLDRRTSRCARSILQPVPDGANKIQ